MVALNPVLVKGTDGPLHLLYARVLLSVLVDFHLVPVELNHFVTRVMALKLIDLCSLGRFLERLIVVESVKR